MLRWGSRARGKRRWREGQVTDGAVVMGHFGAANPSEEGSVFTGTRHLWAARGATRRGLSWVGHGYLWLRSGDLPD